MGGHLLAQVTQNVEAAIAQQQRFSNAVIEIRAGLDLISLVLAVVVGGIGWRWLSGIRAPGSIEVCRHHPKSQSGCSPNPPIFGQPSLPGCGTPQRCGWPDFAVP
jgi:hypothetical protein